MLLDYRELPGALFTKILPHFGIVCGESERKLMRQVARRNAQSPIMPFRADSNTKRQAATQSIRRAAAERVGAVHAKLEALRAG